MNVKLSITALSLLIMHITVAHGEKWDMPLAYVATNYHSEIAAEFAADVRQKSALEIVTHPGGSLLGGAEIFKAVRKGITPIGERIISALGNDDPVYEIDSIPFLATNFDDAKKLYKASKPALVETLDGAGIHFLYSCPWPPQGFYSAQEATDLDALQGMKFRAYNATTSKLAERLGMVPVKIESAELVQAFATGVVQSMFSSGTTGYDRKLWEHVNYYYDTKAWLPRNMVIVNKKAWFRLNEETQDVLTTAAATAEAKCWAKAEELDFWYVEQLRKNGMKIDTLNDSLLAAFNTVGEELKAAWLDRMGPRGEAILEAYEAMK